MIWQFWDHVRFLTSSWCFMKPPLMNVVYGVIIILEHWRGGHHGETVLAP